MGGASKMRFSMIVATALLSCAGSLSSAFGAEESFELRGQLYFEPTPVAAAPQVTVPRHVAQKYVARAPIDFTYPETAASTGASVAYHEEYQPVDQSAWGVDLTDGAKLKIAYDKNTKLSLGVGMWKVRMGVSKKFGDPTAEPWTLPARHGRAAALGRASNSEPGNPLN